MQAEQKAAVRKWILNNRGILEKIAKSVEPPVTKQMTQRVAYGQNKSARIERELKAAGWPG